MSATNKTANYDLPIYLTSDKPTYLADWNSTMTKIDAGITGVKTSADGASLDAANAKAAADGAKTAADAASASVNELSGKVLLNTANIQNIQEKIPTIEANINGVYDINEISYTIKDGWIFGGFTTSYLGGNIVFISGTITAPIGTAANAVASADLTLSGNYQCYAGSGWTTLNWTSGSEVKTGTVAVFFNTRYDQATNTTKINGEVTAWDLAYMSTDPITSEVSTYIGVVLGKAPTA